LPPIEVISFYLLLKNKKAGSLTKNTKINETKNRYIILVIDEKNKNTKKDDGGYVIKDSIQRTVGS